MADAAKRKLLVVSVSVVILIVFLALRQLTTDRGSGNSTAPDVALTDHSAQTQVFDRGILYLCTQQEADGRWSALKSGADPELSSINGDIAVTAVVTAALLDACSNKQNNPDAQAHARRGLEWLSQRVRADGGIADESAPGEPVAAQLLAALTFLQAGELSAREKLGENAERLCRYAVTLQANCGGFGATKNSAVARAELTALGAVMYDKARAANIVLADAVDSKAEQDFERKFDRSIRNGIAALTCRNSTGILALSTDKLEPSWDATAAGLLADVVQMIQGTETQARLCFMTCSSTDPGNAGADSTFPGMERQLRDEPHSAVGIFAGSVVITRVFSSTLPVRIAWTKTVLALLTSKQLSDGSWAAEGPDATRGRLWRTAFNLRIIPLLAH